MLVSFFFFINFQFNFLKLKIWQFFQKISQNSQIYNKKPKFSKIWSLIEVSLYNLLWGPPSKKCLELIFELSIIDGNSNANWWNGNKKCYVVQTPFGYLMSTKFKWKISKKTHIIGLYLLPLFKKFPITLYFSNLDI